MAVHQHDQLVAIQRHGSPEGYRPPHEINHHAHMKALDQLGVETVISVQSTGSLTTEIPPGSFVVPDDYINPWQVVTYFDDERGHGVRTFDDDLRGRILKSDKEIRDGGTYVQTQGPRFETPAEAHLLADYGDIVGMTAVSEMILASELNMNYATVCSVDNYVNGINGTKISMEAFKASVEENLPGVKRLVNNILVDEFEITF